MLIDKSCQKGVKSIYKCDRCGKKVDVKHKIGISTQRYLTNSKKYCDLCEKCFSSMDRGIFKKREESKNAKD